MCETHREEIIQETLPYPFEPSVKAEGEKKNSYCGSTLIENLNLCGNKYGRHLCIYYVFIFFAYLEESLLDSDELDCLVLPDSVHHL
jgi:hypothetical protein